VLKGPWSEEEEAAIMRSAGNVAEFPLHLKSSGDLTIQSLRSQARMVRQEHGLDLIVVDYLQLVQAVDTRQNRVAQVTEVTHGLKALAMDLNVPLLALAQLNREFEKRPSKAPILSDLRESGSIEQDADVVLLLYRPELYFTEEEWMRTSEEPYPRGMAQVNVAKQRNGPLGVFSLVFREETATFRSLARPATQLESVLR
jgi:replicative DNA helicase